MSEQETQTSNESELRQHRLNKLERIRERGDEPFKYKFERSSLIAPVREAFETAEAEAADGLICSGAKPEMTKAVTQEADQACGTRDPEGVFVIDEQRRDFAEA